MVAVFPVMILGREVSLHHSVNYYRNHFTFLNPFIGFINIYFSVKFSYKIASSSDRDLCVCVGFNVAGCNPNLLIYVSLCISSLRVHFCPRSLNIRHICYCFFFVSVALWQLTYNFKRYCSRMICDIVSM